MTTLWAIIKSEIRQTWRQRSFWIAQVLVLVPILLAWQADSYERDLLGGQFVADEVNRILAFELLLLPIVVGPAILRDQEETGELLWTTPLDALTHLGGTLAGLWLALLPVLTGQVGVRWLLGLSVPGTHLSYIWTHGLPLVLAASSAGLGLAVLLAVLLRRTLPLLVVWGGLWLAISGFGGSPGELTTLRNLLFVSLVFSPTVGLGLSRPLVLGLALWFVGLGLVAPLLALGLGLAMDRRQAVRYPAPLILGMIIAIGVLGTGLLTHTRAAVSQAAPSSPADIQLDRWVVRSHTLDATVDPEQNSIAGESTLVLEPTRPITSSQVVLRLNPGLVLTEVSDGSGQTMPFTQTGEGIQIHLPDPPAASCTLQLHWEGSPRPPYADYGTRYTFSSMSNTTPQPLRGLLLDGLGFLLRDGDWYPWPWTTQTHQAQSSRIILRVGGTTALASVPFLNGTASWNGTLPTVLLALLPSGHRSVAGTNLHLSPRAGELLVNLLSAYAADVSQVWSALGERPPTQVIVLPYLNDFAWSGDVLLLPEGSGFQQINEWLFEPYNRTAPTGVEQRARLVGLTHAWVARYMAPPTELVRTGPQGPLSRQDLAAGWQDPQGRWIEPLNSFEIAERDVLALWLAIELADPAVREADLALFQEPLSETAIESFEAFWSRLLPLHSSQDIQTVGATLQALHGWAGELGPERALHLVGETMRQQRPSSLGQFLAELEQASGHRIPIEQAPLRGNP